MKTLICPTCNCSLVRLEIGKDKAATGRYGGEEYYFCCKGCADLFSKDPRKYLQEISDLIVCPTCLGEKPQHLAVKLEVAGQEIYFCRCPHCQETFRKSPDYYVKRLEGLDQDQGIDPHC